MDPHVNYQPPRDFIPPEALDYHGSVDGSARSVHRFARGEQKASEADLAQLKHLYRGEVAYLDTQIRRLYSELDQLQLWDNDTIIVFVADHGEQFGEHGRFKHDDLHIENLHVPLWFNGKMFPKGNIDYPVELIDVVPTLLHALELEMLPHAEGKNLLAHHPTDSVAAITEFGEALRITGTSHSIIKRNESLEIYNHKQDPLEQQPNNEAVDNSENHLVARIEQHENRPIQAAAYATEREVSEETREALEALGYLFAE